MPYYGGGVYISLDVRYVEILGGFSGGSGKWQSAIGAIPPDSLASISRMYLSGGVFGKFPAVDIGKNVGLFPLYGIEYESAASDSADAVSTLKYPDGSKVKFDGQDGHPSSKDVNALWFKFGGGINIGGSGPGLRVEALYGIRLPNRYERNRVNGDARVNPGRGLSVRVALALNRME